MIHGHLSGQLTHQCFWWGSELENWTTEFVQRTTNLEKQSPGLRRSEDHRQCGLSVTARTALGEEGTEPTSWGGGAVGYEVVRLLPARASVVSTHSFTHLTNLCSLMRNLQNRIPKDIGCPVIILLKKIKSHTPATQSSEDAECHRPVGFSG